MISNAAAGTAIVMMAIVANGCVVGSVVRGFGLVKQNPSTSTISLPPSQENA